MKKITIALLATVASVGLMSSAFAADLIVEEPVDYPEVALGSNWDGPFIGVFVGGGWGTADHIPVAPVDGNDVDLSGWLVGVDAGWNFALGGGGGLVVGVVGDVAWADIGGTLDGPTPIGGYSSIDHDIDWTASLRGRIGWDGGQWMPYLTAGVAWAHATREQFGPATPAFDVTHVGWTAGVGVEVAVTQDVSVDLLWRYNDFGEEVYSAGTIPNVSLTSNTFTAGLHWNF